MKRRITKRRTTRFCPTITRSMLLHAACYLSHSISCTHTMWITILRPLTCYRRSDRSDRGHLPPYCLPVWGVQEHRKHTRRSLAKTLAARQYSAKSAARICISRRTPPEITDTTEVSLKDIMSCRLEVPSPWSRHCFSANRVAASMGSPRGS